MQVNLPDPPLNEGALVFGNAVSATEFQGVLTHGLFKNVVPDPRRLEGPLAKHNPDLSGVAELRRRSQRLITGAKRRNVEPYAQYIIRMVQTREGFTPQIVLWTPRELRVEVDTNTGFAWALIPHELKFVALDGDTQTTARYIADGLHQGLFDKEKIKVTIRHGVREEVAQQIFADCNSQGVKVSTSMAIGLDNRDDATQLTKFVEHHVPALEGKVNRQKRQLGNQDPELVTISALRAAVVCFVEGINGIQNQTRNVEIDEEKIDALRSAAVMWFAAVTSALKPALVPGERAKTFASAPAVWCALGALGYEMFIELAGEGLEKSVTTSALEHAFRACAESLLAPVNWTRGEHWLAVGAKKSATGAITLGGPKETGSLVFKGLKDGTLRRTASVAA